MSLTDPDGIPPALSSAPFSGAFSTRHSLLENVRDAQAAGVGGVVAFVHDWRRDRFLIDAKGREILGLSVVDLSAEDWLARTAPEDRGRVAGELARRDADITYRFRLDGPAGAPARHFEVRARGVADELGGPDHAVGVVIDVSAHVQAKEGLRISAEMLRLGQKAGKIATFLRDLKRNTVICDSESRQLIGLPPGEGEISPVEWQAVMPPDERQRVARLMAEAVARGDAEVAYRFSTLRPGEVSPRTFEMRAHYLRDAEGRPDRSIAVAIDVTDSVRAAERLRISEEISRLGQKCARVAVFSRDLQTNVYEFSPEAREILGLPQDVTIDIDYWMNVVAPEDRERVGNIIRETAANRRHELEAEHRIRRPSDGQIRVLDVRVHFYYDEQGRPLRSLGAFIDVTDSRKAAEELRLSEDMRRLGQEVGGVLIFLRDLATDSITMTPESHPVFGVSAEDAPRTMRDLDRLVVPEDRVRVRQTVNEAARRGDDVALEFRFRRPNDGEIRHMELRAHCLKDETGRAARAINVGIDVTQRKLAEDKLLYAARHDAVTGLPNRTLFRERLDEALARSHRGEKFAVLCLDLDRFKEVNDTLGHAAGDRLLVMASQRITSQLRETDVLARLGGDEFAVLCGGLHGPESAGSLAERMVRRICEPFELEGESVQVGVSIGVAMGLVDGERQEDLMRAADMALYEAKNSGRGRYAFFTAEMNAHMQTRRKLRLDLEAALERGEFELFYQPIVDACSRRLAGFEALIRWRRPDGRFASPDSFIPLCEETGLIAPLGAWVTATACREAVNWPNPLSVAVNLSPYQFASSRLERDILHALETSGLDPARLELEITESAVLRETEATLATLSRLKARGLRIAMDDFGAGYSSLSYLRRFPFDRVKIDRDFTREIADSRKTLAIVKTLADLCSVLEMSTTAEGVETEAQLTAVVEAGCRRAQGYLFSPPRPAAEIGQMIAKFGDGVMSAAAE